MNDNIDLKKLWNKQETSIPDAKEIFEKTKKFKMYNLKKIIITNILLISTSVFIASIWFNYQPAMITTKIGIVLTILAMVLYLFVYNQMIPLLMKVDYDVNSSQYLQQLLKIKEKQRFLYNTMLNIYFILLSIGICVYMIEFVMRMTWIGAIISYGATLGWIAISWFFIRPRTVKKQQAKMNELIGKYEEIKSQLS